MEDDAANHKLIPDHDDLGRSSRGFDLAGSEPPVDSYRAEIEFMDAAAEFQLRELIDHFRRDGRQNLIAALNDVLKAHCLQVVEVA